MAVAKILMPQMGESVMEGTVIKWLVKPGDTVNEEDSVIEIATDKVDTDIPSPYGGKIIELFCEEGDVVQVGKTIATIETESVQDSTDDSAEIDMSVASKEQIVAKIESEISSVIEESVAKINANRFYSPLVLNIAKKEGINQNELEQIPGTGKEARVTKSDILKYLEAKANNEIKIALKEEPVEGVASTSLDVVKPSFEFDTKVKATPLATSPKLTGDFEVVPMNRTRKIIAERMKSSQQISAHVTSIVEADVSNIVYWRNRWKTHFKDKENVLLTFTPIFIEAVVKAIKDYPKINASVDGENIIYKKDINIGIAVALPDGNLVVPVIKRADQLNIVGLTTQVNDLAKRARKGKLKPQDLEGGTYTVSNVGSFGNLIGTPIIVQPQVGILALGTVVKKPAVIETPYGDTLGIRHQMFLSHSYDHRIVDGSLGGMFVRRVADYLEKFDLERKV